jgi:hypothetical protein
LRTLAIRLEVGDEKDFEVMRQRAGPAFRALMIEAAIGTVPEGKESERKAYRSHAERWFKNYSGGHELAQKMFSLGAWPSLKPQLIPFCNAVRQALGQPNLADLG